MSKKVHLLIIDPQVDFCMPGGSLVVPGAEQDMDNRMANFVLQSKDKFEDIHVTLDSHHYVDIAHPIMWKDRNGNHPAPFTIVTKADVMNAVWSATIPSLQKRLLDYVTKLEDNKRYPLCIWPPHCLIGTPGSNVVPNLMNSLIEWNKTFAIVDFVTKGSNPFTEHYSAVQADVPDPADPSTQLNVGLIQTLENDADEIIIAGEALSHCVANTVTDIANNFKDKSAISKFVLLTDASSSVGGFEKFGTDFIDAMVKQGMKLTTTKDYLF